ncbi:MAG TPA: response regulator [Nitrososphaera sp.]|nr:response regulator [Nitrososphaera sp.]
MSLSIVDDEPDITAVFCRALTRSNFRVTAFNSSSEALVDFKEGSYDLAIMDFKMPTINGFELYEKMHLIDKRMKVLFISGDHAHYREKMLSHPELETSHFMDKPASLDTLVKRIREILLQK